MPHDRGNRTPARDFDISSARQSHGDSRGMQIDRRIFLGGLSAALVAPIGARAESVTDSAGRAVPVPAKVTRVFPAGPPAAITLYTVAPDLLLGWPRANRADEREFLDREDRRTTGGRPHHRPRQYRQSRSGAGAQARPDPRHRHRQQHLHLARRPRAAADRHSLCAARRPLRRHRRHLPHHRRTDRTPRRRRSRGALCRRNHQDDHRPPAAAREAAARLLRARAARARDRARRLDQRGDDRTARRAMSRAARAAASPPCRSRTCWCGIRR